MNQAEQKHLAQSSDEKPVMLDNWERCGCNAHVIVFPHLRGNTYNHPRFSDGEIIHTSELISISGNIAVCKTRTFHLLRPKQ